MGRFCASRLLRRLPTSLPRTNCACETVRRFWVEHSPRCGRWRAPPPPPSPPPHRGERGSQKPHPDAPARLPCPPPPPNVGEGGRGGVRGDSSSSPAISPNCSTPVSG